MQISIQLLDDGSNSIQQKHQFFELKSSNIANAIDRFKNKLYKMRVLEFLNQNDLPILIQFIKNCPSIRQLDLSALPKKFLLTTDLLNCLSTMTHLQAIRLDEMNLQTADILVLAPFFQNLGITNLSIQLNDIGDLGLKTLLVSAENMANLKILNVSYNNISPVGCDLLIKFLKIKRLSVNIAGNHFNEEQALIFAQNFKDSISSHDTKINFSKKQNNIESSELDMELVHIPDEDDKAYADMSSLIYGEKNENQILNEFWQVFLTELSAFYLKHSIKELFNDNLNDNLIINDFAEINLSVSFTQIIEKFEALQQKKPFLAKSIQLLKQIDFRNEDIKNFRARIVFQLIKMSKEVAAHYNASFEIFKNIQEGIHKFLSTGITLALKQERPDFYAKLKQFGPCNNTQDFVRYLDLLQECLSQYRDLNLTWHEDMNLDAFNAAANQIKDSLKIQDDDRIAKTFENLVPQFNQEYNLFQREPVFSTRTNEGKVTLQIDATHLRCSDIQYQLQALPQNTKQVFIVCSGAFLMDQDIVLSGINLTIYSIFTYSPPGAKTINLSPVFTLLEPGRDGSNFVHDGEHQQEKCGSNGQSGLGGAASGNLNFITHNATSVIKQFTVLVNGNPGSKGGKAGDGANGIRGKDGDDAEMPGLGGVHHEEDFIGYAKGGDGKPASRGGNTGSPGAGGLAGSYGYINIYDLATCDHDIKHGKLGEDGKDGDFGTPGAGAERTSLIL
jgi:hypothetical protein